jgi:hypothetical protein
VIPSAKLFALSECPHGVWRFVAIVQFSTGGIA